MNDKRIDETAQTVKWSGELDALIEDAIRSRPMESLPKGFVGSTLDLATGHPRFRLLPIDFVLPIIISGLIFLVARITNAVTAGAGPIWLRRSVLWAAEAWSAWSPLPPPPPAAGAVVLCCIVALAAAWTVANAPAANSRPLKRVLGARSTPR